MWYVMQVLSGEEQKYISLMKNRIDNNLFNDVFFPKYITKRRYGGVWKELEKDLFPGYLIIDCEDILSVYKNLNKLETFRKVLKTGDYIDPITLGEQDYLQKMMDENRIVQLSKGIIVGEKVVITEGALKNFAGMIKKIDRHKREAKLDISFFGRQTPVTVGLEVLFKIDEAKYMKIKEKNLIDMGVENPNVYTNDTIVEVISGIFTGMRGVLMSEDSKSCKVRLMMEDTPVNVSFEKNEVVTV